ncbi:hypothetical protein HQ487_00330 [Candidatus Uhrbacteria bacterium]|nr:hypothetical protein [Candidatus Uhrbacteria bacterium]
MHDHKGPVSTAEQHSTVHFPDGLDLCDRELILVQSENQDTVERARIEAFAQAYLEAKQLATGYIEGAPLTKDQLEECLLKWAEFIEKQNKGYRTSEIKATNGNRRASAQEVPRLMKRFLKELAGPLDQNNLHRMTPTEFCREFQEICPFEKGNVRIGHLVWAFAIARETKRWPDKLPPDIFN